MRTTERMVGFLHGVGSEQRIRGARKKLPSILLWRPNGMPQNKGNGERQHARLIRSWVFVFLGFSSLLLSFVPAASGRTSLIWPLVVSGVLLCVFGIITIARKGPNNTLSTHPEYKTDTPQNS